MSSATPRRAGAVHVALACGLSAVLLFALSHWRRPSRPTADLPVPTRRARDDYIVTLADAPIAAYDGDVAGYDATQPADGERVDVDQRGREALPRLPAQAPGQASRLGSERSREDRYEVGAQRLHRRMTGRQAATLARTDGVVSVHREHSAQSARRPQVRRLPGSVRLRRCLVPARWPR